MSATRNVKKEDEKAMHRPLQPENQSLKNSTNGIKRTFVIHRTSNAYSFSDHE